MGKKLPLVVISAPWALYEGEVRLPIGLGLIVSERPRFVDIASSEDQLERNNSQCWKIEYIKRFDTPEQAIQYYSEKVDYPVHLLVSQFQRDFPNIPIPGLDLDYARREYSVKISNGRTIIRQGQRALRELSQRFAQPPYKSSTPIGLAKAQGRIFGIPPRTKNPQINLFGVEFNGRAYR